LEFESAENAIEPQDRFGRPDFGDDLREESVEIGDDIGAAPCGENDAFVDRAIKRHAAILFVDFADRTRVIVAADAHEQRMRRERHRIEWFASNAHEPCVFFGGGLRVDLGHDALYRIRFRDDHLAIRRDDMLCLKDVERQPRVHENDDGTTRTKFAFVEDDRLAET